MFGPDCNSTSRISPDPIQSLAWRAVRGKSAGALYTEPGSLSAARQTYGDINHLEPISVPDEVVGEHDSPLQARIRPFRFVWVSNVESSYRHGLDLVALLGDEAFDGLLVGIAKDGRHRGIAVGRGGGR